MKHNLMIIKIYTRNKAIRTYVQNHGVVLFPYLPYKYIEVCMATEDGTATIRLENEYDEVLKDSLAMCKIGGAARPLANSTCGKLSQNACNETT